MIDPALLAVASQSPREALWFATPEAIVHAMQMRALARPLAADPLKVRDAGAVRVITIDRVLHYDPAAWYAIPMAELARQFDAARADDTVGAVVIDFDYAPGSTAFGMLDLGDAANRLAEEKPLIGHCSGLCASGSYWLASCCRQLFASRRTDVGSIGTRMLLYDYSKAFENEGIRPVVIDTGEFKSMGAFGTEITDNHVAHLQSQIDALQGDFLAQVAAGRRLEGKALEAVADGRVWLAELAEPLGLHDGVQTLEETIQLAAELAPKPSTKPRSSTMSETSKNEPQAATLAELKVCCPGASSDFLLAQIEAGATKEQAMQAHMKALQEANEAERNAREEAEQRAADAEEKAAKAGETPATQQPAGKPRGNKPPVASAEQADGAEPNYRAMARDYMREHKCRWSQACLAIKRQHPGALVEFGGPPQV